MGRAVCISFINVALASLLLLHHPCAGGPPRSGRGGELPLTACDNETQFDCEYDEGSARKCIPVDWLCDNVVDCEKTREDEKMCRYIHFCSQKELSCRNGACVEAAFKCDGIDDCGDGTDERGCLNRTSPLKECPLSFFRCNNGPCITVRAKCDSVQDCPEGEDEYNCPLSESNSTVTCGEHQFLCDKTCIPRSWKCDGRKDCSDGSDEVEEECAAEADEDEFGSLPSRDDYHVHSTNRSLCSSSEFLCEPGLCIGRERLCDLKADCPKGNDEGSRCGECIFFGCSHRCTDTPHGAECSCREGEQLSFDGRICEDIDECATPAGRICSHRCVNMQRKFECACFDRYQLANDGHNCHADGDPFSSVIFSLGSEIRHMPPYSAGSTVGYGTTQRNDEVGTVVHSVSFSPRQNSLIMAVTNVDQLGLIQSSKNGFQHCLVEKVVGISNIAVDWITTNIYYTAQYPSKVPGIGVCTWDGRFCRLLVSGVANDEYYRRQAYHGLVVNPKKGLMYWIDVLGKPGSPKIMVSSMDGSKVRALVTSKMSHPQGLAMDYLREHLYYADVDFELIQRIDVNSRERLVVTSRGVHHPHALAFFDDFLYWSDFSTEAILAVRIGSEDFPHVVHSLDQMPYGIAINHSVLWDLEVSNPCETAKCRLCVLAHDGGEVMSKCICPNLYAEEEDGHCRPLNSSEIADLGQKEVPIMCMESMATRCENGDACFNGGLCRKVLDDSGFDERIVCDCLPEYSGQYCEVGKEWAEETMQAVESAWLLTLLAFTLCFTVAFIIYFSSSKCPFIARVADRLIMASSLWHFGGNRDEDREVIVKQTTLVYERDGFNNPSYHSPHQNMENETFTTGASPTYNTLPQSSSVPERLSPSPRFTLGSSSA